jgi:hypothetical protein
LEGLILVLSHYLINITPFPILPRFEGFYHRMLCLLKVFGGMLILGIITAANMTTGEAKS